MSHGLFSTRLSVPGIIRQKELIDLITPESGSSSEELMFTLPLTNLDYLLGESAEHAHSFHRLEHWKQKRKETNHNTNKVLSRLRDLSKIWADTNPCNVVRSQRWRCAGDIPQGPRRFGSVSLRPRVLFCFYSWILSSPIPDTNPCEGEGPSVGFLPFGLRQWSETR